MPLSVTIESLMDRLSPTAASFIVTIYGDVVVPRGGVLWTGSLIETCSRVGFSESLVRTATSRLVAAGRLDGERSGRRSFYRLATAARTEFAEAATLLYARQTEPAGWLIQHAPGLSEDEVRHHRMAAMGGDVWICPDRGQDPAPAALTFRTAILEGLGAPEAVGRFWELSALQSRYTAMIACFRPLADYIAAGRTISADDALIARLLLVEVYRGALLRDPRLPSSALPPDWPGAEANSLFRNLYVALSPQADARVGQALEGKDGMLPCVTDETRARLAALA